MIDKEFCLHDLKVKDTLQHATTIDDNKYSLLLTVSDWLTMSMCQYINSGQAGLSRKA